MGTVTERACESRHGQLAMDALGRLDDAEHAELAAHLVACEECRATLAELRSTVGALDTMAARANSAPVTAVPPRLADAVFADLHAGERVSDHRTGWKVGLVWGSIAAAVIAAAVLSFSLTRPDVPTRTVALQGAKGVTATAVLTEKPWGTAVTIHEQGLALWRSYTVSMDNRQGRWWVAGSYRTLDPAPVEATMTCAATFASIDEIRVTDSSGRTVLSNYVEPGTPPRSS